MSSRRQHKEQLRAERLERERAAAEAARRQRLVRIGFAAVLALVLIAVVVVLATGGGDDGSELESDSQKVEAMFRGVPQAGLEAGDPDAPVTLVEFADLQCPFCAEFAVKTLPNLIERYVRDGDLRYRLRLISFIGDDSVAAAEMAAAAGLQDRGVAFAELFYLNQGPENSGYATEGFLRDLADATPGLDADAALEARSSEAVQAQLADSEREASRLGIDSTPSFLLAGDGDDPQPFTAEPTDSAAFEREIERLLGE